MRIEKLRRLHKEFLLEGGAAGHLRHLYDNPDLTFGELQDVLTRAAQGRLEKVSEKLDGVNLVFTWDVSGGGLRVARTGGDIKKGGMDAGELAKKFWGRGNVEEAFNSGFKVLQQALGSIPDQTKNLIFGENGNFWYSLELIYSGLANTINYDQNNIVFHEWPIHYIDDEGNTSQVDNEHGVAVLSQQIERMQVAVQQRSWRVRGPAMMRLKKLSDGSILEGSLARIQEAMGVAGVDESDTIRDYIYAMVQNEAADLGVGTDVVDAIAERIAKVPGAPTLTQIKKMVDKEQKAIVGDFVKGEKVLKERLIRPIERAIHDFTIEVLKGLRSALIADSAKEVQRLRSQVSSAIESIEASGHKGAMAVVEKQMDKLKSIENIGSPMEGIVFTYKGNSYKFTGAFAPAHQILALFTFGRKGIDPADLRKKQESLKYAWPHRLILEGGHAFDNVGVILQNQLEATWPHILGDLSDIGVYGIKPIGTTFKKDEMGDIDIVGEYDGTRDELYGFAQDAFGSDSVKKVGANIITISYPIHDELGEIDTRVQVDLMLGDPDYISWARYGPSPHEGHEEFSAVKGVVRNVLLNTILRFAAQKTFPDEQGEHDRVKYAVDFDKGLYLIRQTKRGKVTKQQTEPRINKNWRTTEREFITKNPDEIVEVIFGEEDDVLASELKTFEQLVAALRSSRGLGDMAQEILETFVEEITQIIDRDDRMAGGDPEGTITAIKRITGIDT